MYYTYLNSSPFACPPSFVLRWCQLWIWLNICVLVILFLLLYYVFWACHLHWLTWSHESFVQYVIFCPTYFVYFHNLLLVTLVTFAMPLLSDYTVSFGLICSFFTLHCFWLVPSFFTHYCICRNNSKFKSIFHGSGYRSSSRPSFFKTYSSIACNMTVMQDKYALGCTTLGRNILNLNHKSLKNFEKSKVELVPWMKSSTTATKTKDAMVWAKP